MDTIRMSKVIAWATPAAVLAYNAWVVFIEPTKHDSISRQVFNFNQDHPALGALTVLAIGLLAGHWFAPRAPRRWTTAGLAALTTLYGLAVAAWDAASVGIGAALAAFPADHPYLWVTALLAVGALLGHWITPMRVRVER